MRRILGVVPLLFICAVAFAGDGDYKKITGKQRLEVTGDGAGDSTRTSGRAALTNNAVEGYTSVFGTVVLGPELSGYAGAGNQDSGWVWLRAVWGAESVVLDSAAANSMPVTLRYMLATAGGTDTVLKEALVVDWEIYDSLGDSTAELEYDIWWNFILK